MSAVRELRRVLWTVVLATGCGRIGFGEAVDEVLADAPAGAVAELPTHLELVAECGALAPEIALIVVRNTGASDLVIDDAEVTGGFSLVTGLPLVIAPGEQADLVVAPPAAVIGTDRGGELKQGSLVLATNEDSSSTRTVSLTATIVGANIKFGKSPTTPLDLSFMSSGGLCPSPKEMWIANDGTAQVTLTIGNSNGLVSTFSSGMVAAGGGSSGVLRATTTGPCAGMGSLTYVITGPSCTTTPVVLSSTLDIAGSASCFCS